MLEIARMLYTALGASSPKTFITVSAAIGAVVFGLLATLLVLVGKTTTSAPPSTQSNIAVTATLPPRPAQRKATTKPDNRKRLDGKIVQNAPGGINIGGDNNGTAIVNNGPPPLALTFSVAPEQGDSAFPARVNEFETSVHGI